MTTDDEHALVQVFIYGLASLELKEDEEGNLEQVTAHFPVAMDHDLDVHHGVNRVWQELATQQPEGTTISFDTRQPMKTNDDAGGNFGVYPGDSTEAADAGWMMPASALEGTYDGYDGGKSDSHAVFQAGTLETCGLVHSDDETVACRIKPTRLADDDEAFSRTASEYMVVRYLIPYTETLNVNIGGSPMPIALSQGLDAQWGSTTYPHHFDVLITNVPPRGAARPMESDHGDLLKPLFVGRTHSWSVMSPDCPDGTAGSCTCEEGVQPPCLNYLLNEYSGSPGSTNRPICMLIEGS